MYRSRAVACLALAALCILLAAAVAAAQASGSSGTEAKHETKGGFTDDEPIIVKPKGGSTETVGVGLGWMYQKNDLAAGEAKRFRDDLFEKLKSLEACKTVAVGCSPASAVRFNLGRRVLEVRKKWLGYKWDIPSNDKPEACEKGVDCKESGIPPEFMEGSMRGIIEAKFGRNSDWVTVEEVRLKPSH